MNTSKPSSFHTTGQILALLASFLIALTIPAALLADDPTESQINQTVEASKNRPVRAALDFARRMKIDLSKHQPESAFAVRYCPPQPTVYEWLVVLPPSKKQDAPKLMIAVPAAGQPWRLDPVTLNKIR